MLRASVLAFIAVLAAPAQSKWVVPSFHDLTIKTRETRGLSHPMVTTWYFKGPRERNELLPDGSLNRQPFTASIMQCDLRTQIRLFEHTKTYISLVDHSRDTDRDAEEARRRKRPPRPQPVFGPEVTVTSDSVDTGERRPIGTYEARRVKTTLTIEPSKEAASKPGRVEIDGWYLDLPGLYCHEDSTRENGPPIAGWLMLVRGSIRDHVIFKILGTPPRGLVVEETAKQRQAGNTIVNKTELVEVSDQPLDESLFEVPPDYVLKEKPEGHTLLRTPDFNSPQP
jgi:hypothetical protein